MKDRFWIAYYYIMWFLFLFGLFVYVDSFISYYDSFFFFQDIYFFNEYGSEVWSLWLIFLFILLTVIRWVGTGKHFWNRP